MALCRKIMEETIEQTDGVYCIEFDPVQRNLLWRYDPEQLAADALPTEYLSARIAENIATCRLHTASRTGVDLSTVDAGTMCASCRQQASGRGHCEHLRHFAREGMISVHQGEECPAAEYCASLATHLVPLAAPAADESTGRIEAPRGTSGPETWGRRIRSWGRSVRTALAGVPREPVAVAVTLVAMISGAIFERVAPGELTLTVGAASAGTANAMALLSYAVAYIAGGYFGLRAGIETLKERRIDIDLLMILAAIGAAIIGAPFEGALLLFLFSLSNVLQDFALDRTRNAIRALMKLRPSRAEVERNGERVVVPVDAVAVGERFFIRPGDRVPLDGEIVTGESGMDESLLTGESRPVRKGPCDEILAGSINTNGSLQVRVTRASDDSTIAKIIRLVEDAQSKKARTERFLDTFEQYYAIFVVLLTIAFAVVPVVGWGEAFAIAFYRAITVMVAASPCALIISTPASVLSAIGAGAKRGILFKGGVYVEQAGGIKAIAFDKTGTLTHGKPELTDVVSLDDRHDRDEIVRIAAAVEQHSEHALAKATVAAAADAAGDGGATLDESVAFQAVAGRGVEATLGDRRIRIGAPAYFDDLEIDNRDAASAEIHRLRSEQKTVVAVTEIGAAAGDGDSAAPTGHFLGLVAFSDRLRESAPTVIRRLRELGMQHIIMLTGDNRETADAIAAEAGIDEVYAELAPEDKLEAIREMEARHGAVAMVGDGVNDAPSLAQASLGIAMGAGGTDVAMETADVVLMADDLEQVPFLVELSRRTRRTLVFNLGLAISLIALMIAGIVAFELPLPLAVIGHEGGTVLVSLNGLRLLFYKTKRKRSSVGVHP